MVAFVFLNKVNAFISVNYDIGRAIRHKGDYATILLLDHRYLRPSIREKLPSWISESLSVMDRFGPAFAAIRKVGLVLSVYWPTLLVESNGHGWVCMLLGC